MRPFGLALLFALAGCAPFSYYGAFANVTAYRVTPRLRTLKGIAVDASGKTLDLGALDQATDEVEACLKQAFPSGTLPALPAAHCLTQKFDPALHRDAFRVKVAPDEHVGCDGQQQFPCTIDPVYCTDKGLTVTPACPCQCRSTLQDNSTVVTTSDLHLYKAELLRMVTTCNFIWASPQLSACAVDEHHTGGMVMKTILMAAWMLAVVSSCKYIDDPKFAPALPVKCNQDAGVGQRMECLGNPIMVNSVIDCYVCEKQHDCYDYQHNTYCVSSYGCDDRCEKSPVNFHPFEKSVPLDAGMSTGAQP